MDQFKSSTIACDIEQALWQRDRNALDTLCRGSGKDIELKNIRYNLIRSLENVRHHLMSNAISIPEFLLILDMVGQKLDELASPSETGSQPDAEIPLVIGVVEGDPHDLGKNIIARIYATSGYRVFNLGRNIAESTFVASVLENHARVLALSAMMSTTMAHMPAIIKKVKDVSPDTVVMVGGAPLDETLAKSYGADGYAESALTIVEETEAALQRIGGGQSC